MLEFDFCESPDSYDVWRLSLDPSIKFYCKVYAYCQFFGYENGKTPYDPFYTFSL